MLSLSAGACCFIGGKENIDPEQPEEIVEEKKDTTWHESVLSFEAPYAIETVDVFAYETSGMMQLSAYVHAEGSSARMRFMDTAPKSLAVVANARGKFNVEGLQHFDSIDQLRAALSNEDPRAPLMSGRGFMTPGRDTSVRVTPLLCRVVIASVTNYFEDDVLAENPRVRLENVNTLAEMFKLSEFPVMDMIDGKTVYLPNDIGLYTQHPGTELYCYPNDIPNPTGSNPATTLVFECEIKGVTWASSYTLHPISRGDVIPVEVEIR